MDRHDHGLHLAQSVPLLAGLPEATKQRVTRHRLPGHRGEPVAGQERVRRTLK